MAGEASYRELAHARQRAAEEMREHLERTEQSHRDSEAARHEFENSERGDVARANREAERIMRLPTHEALREMGSVVGDPTRGPAS